MFDFYYNLTRGENGEDLSNVRKIVECGLQTTIMVILALVGSAVPIFGILAFLCYPSPILILTVRFGFREGFLAGFVAFIIISMFLNPFAALRIFLLGVPIGLFLGYGFRKKWSYFKMISIGSVFSTVLLCIVISLITYLLGDILISNFVFFPKYEDIPLFNGADITSPEAAQAMFSQFLYLTWPTILYISGLAMIVPSVIWPARLLKRFGLVETPDISSFSEFRLPILFTAAFGVSVVSLALGFSLNHSLLIQFGFNLNLICSLFGFVSGTSLYCYFTKLYHWHIAFRVIAFILILSITFLGEIMTWIGLLDPVINFRNRFKRKQDMVPT